jgi:hypothetical protein
MFRSSARVRVLSAVAVIAVAGGLAQPAAADRPEASGSPHAQQTSHYDQDTIRPTFLGGGVAALGSEPGSTTAGEGSAASDAPSWPGEGRVAWDMNDWSVKAGGSATLRGRVLADGETRVVRLEQRIGSGWRTVAMTGANKAGRFKFMPSTSWVYSTPMRATAFDAQGMVLGTSEAMRFRSKTPYRLVGPRDGNDLNGDEYQLRWNGCEPITYRMNAKQASPKLRVKADTRAAIRMIELATGFTFEYLGPTKAVPGSGGHWPADTDLVISWNTPSETEWGLGPDAVAMGGAIKAGWGQIGEQTHVDGVQLAQILTAGISIDVTQTLLNDRDQTKVLMHELGHTVGLRHTPARGQIMGQTDYNAPLRWGRGDMVGLRHLGLAGGCVTPRT